MDRLPVYLIVSCLVIMIGSMTWAVHTCYFCEENNNPVGSDCWNQTAKVAKIVNCTKPCYTRIFQSGGGHDSSNYWSIKRGCTGLHNDENYCEESTNCDSKHFGACVTCCSENLCNGVSARDSLQPAIIVCLIASLLYNLPYSGLFV